MTDLRDRHRRWLDAQMPTATEIDASMRASLRPRDAGPRRWPIVTAIAVAATAAIVIATRPTPTLPPPTWDVSLALHVAGRPAGADVRILLAVRKPRP